MATMDSKYIQQLRKISAVLLRLISRTLKLFPFGLVMVPVILFYFAPDSFLAEIIHEWKKADISEQQRNFTPFWRTIRVKRERGCPYNCRFGWTQWRK